MKQGEVKVKNEQRKPFRGSFIIRELIGVVAIDSCSFSMILPSSKSSSSSFMAMSLRTFISV